MLPYIYSYYKRIYKVYAKRWMTLVRLCLLLILELKIVAGFYESQLFDKDAVGILARLPSRNILLAQLCGTLMAPITSLAIVLKQISEKMQTEKSQI